MARLTIIDPAQATGETKELLDEVKAKIGAIPNMHRALANSPAALRAYLDLNSACSGGNLDAAMRERIALGTAEHNACTYCLSAHTFLAKNVAKLDQHEIDAARRFESGDERVAAGLRFARAVLEQRGEVSDEDLDRVRAAGYSDGELAEIVANVALNTLTNYFNRLAAPDLEFPGVEPVAIAA
jgi:uncharacterized peroxidase-related enzyme